MTDKRPPDDIFIACEEDRPVPVKIKYHRSLTRLNPDAELEAMTMPDLTPAAETRGPPMPLSDERLAALRAVAEAAKLRAGIAMRGPYTVGPGVDRLTDSAADAVALADGVLALLAELSRLRTLMADAGICQTCGLMLNVEGTGGCECPAPPDRRER